MKESRFEAAIEADEYEIARYQPLYRDQILELQTHLWGSDREANAAYFEWKYCENPYHDSPIIYIALFRGHVVGMRGFIGTQWQGGNSAETHLWLCLADSVVHPDHRRHGLFSRISTTALEKLSDSGYDYVLNLSSGPMSTSGNLKLGWQSTGSSMIAERRLSRSQPSAPAQRSLVRNLPVLAAINRRIRSYLTSSASRPSAEFAPYRLLDRNAARGQSDTGLRISVEKAPIPDAMSSLIERIDRDGRFRQVRDHHFFNWRFRNPRSIYRFLLGWRGDRLAGYLIIRRAADPRKGGYLIVDWEGEDFQVDSDLLRAAVEWGEFEYLWTWATSLSQERKLLLKKHGFETREETGGTDGEFHRPSILVKSLRQPSLDPGWQVAGKDLLDSANWDLRPIFADGY